jgi:hypothetical protein
MQNKSKTFLTDLSEKLPPPTAGEYVGENEEC